MKKRILVPYMAATLAMAASISVAARDGAVVARSYMNYNDQKPSVAAEYRYQTVGISWTYRFAKCRKHIATKHTLPKIER